MTSAQLRGVYVPLVTPFGDDGSVDFTSLQRLANESLDAGATGLVALATTGEVTSLTDDERDDVVRALSELSADRGTPLIVGAATNNTDVTVKRHHALADVPGVIASLAVVPYYVRPSESAIVRHFEFVSEGSPVPLVIYNIPYRTGRGLGPDSLLELASIPGIAGVKQAVGSLDADTLRVLAEAPSDFAVLGGDDAFLAPLVLMGGAGAIAASAHLCTDRFVAMIDAALAGDAAKARPHAEALLPLVQALFAEPSPAVLKAILHEEGRISTPSV
ncbi:MAG TPA: dihydrodipicolinate synthase family protein, partial [Gaiellaceae bacterium]